jgi:hypothetical protein
MSQITLSENIKSHLNSALSQIYTSMPAKVIKIYKVGSSTVVDVKPLLNMRFNDGSVEEEPPLGGVMIKWPSAGGCFITCPIEVGDTVDLNFSMRALTEHKNSDGKEPQTAMSKRLHNMNDAYATPCATVYEKGHEVDPDALVLSSKAIEIRITNEGVIELGKEATESLIKGNQFLTAFLDHKHTYIDSVGPSATATPRLTTEVGAVVSVPDIITAWEPNLSEVSFTK